MYASATNSRVFYQPVLQNIPPICFAVAQMDFNLHKSLQRAAIHSDNNPDTLYEAQNVTGITKSRPKAG